MKNFTKKQIKEVLKSKNSTLIFKLAQNMGVDVKNKSNVFDFIKNNATTERESKIAYNIAFCSGHSKEMRCWNVTDLQQPVFFAIKYAKDQKIQGRSNYSKKLFVGDKNIYWCHPGYGHRDYNKGVAFENNEKNRKIADTINRYLGY